MRIQNVISFVFISFCVIASSGGCARGEIISEKFGDESIQARPDLRALQWLKNQPCSSNVSPFMAAAVIVGLHGITTLGDVESTGRIEKYTGLLKDHINSSIRQKTWRTDCDMLIPFALACNVHTFRQIQDPQ